MRRVPRPLWSSFGRMCGTALSSAAVGCVPAAPGAVTTSDETSAANTDKVAPLRPNTIVGPKLPPKTAPADIATLSVEAFRAIVVSLPQRCVASSLLNWDKCGSMKDVVNAYRNSARCYSRWMIMERKELEDNAIAARDGTKPLRDCLLSLIATEKRIWKSLRLDDTRDSLGDHGWVLVDTYEDVWKAAVNVFGSKHKAPMRFLNCCKYWYRETELFKTRIVVPAPLDLALNCRHTKVHVFPGESGIGKTARLMMGAYSKSSATYNRTLGVYFSNACPAKNINRYDYSDQGWEKVTEEALARVETPQRDLIVHDRVVELVNDAMYYFFRDRRFRFDLSDGIFRERALVICLDDLGSRPLFVQAVISDNQGICNAISAHWGFGNVVVMIAGTGVERAALASDPDKHTLHTVPPGDRQLFRALMVAESPMKAIMQGDEPWKRFPELDGFVQNRRLSYYLACSLSQVTPSMTKSLSFGLCLRNAMVTASMKYCQLRALAKLTDEEMQVLFADVLCATMLGPSFHVGLSFNTSALMCCLRDAAVCRTAVLAGDVVLHNDADCATRTVVIPPTAGTADITRYRTTASLQMALQLLVGGGLTRVGSIEEFEVHIASYAACCYLAVSRLASAMRTAATFLALLSQGTRQPLKPENRSGATVWTLPDAAVASWHPTASGSALAAAVAGHRLEQTSVKVVVLTTPLSLLRGEETDDATERGKAVKRDLEVLRQASRNAVTVVVTARRDSPADVVVVIRGLGMLPISCKKHEDAPGDQALQELWRMGAVVEQSALQVTQQYFAARSEECRTNMRNLGAACGLEGAALRIVGFQLAFLQAAPTKAGNTTAVDCDVKEVPAVSLATSDSTALSPSVPVKYFVCGGAFENTFPLQRFSPIHETFDVVSRASTTETQSTGDALKAGN